MAWLGRKHYAPGDTPADRRRRSLARQQQLNATRHETREYQFYQSQEWRLLRSRMLKAHPQCRRCGALGQAVDHILPLKQAWDLRLTPVNLQVLCHSCHSKKTAKENDRINGMFA